MLDADPCFQLSLLITSKTKPKPKTRNHHFLNIISILDISQLNTAKKSFKNIVLAKSPVDVFIQFLFYQ
jgi:hypothetical protein